VGLYRWHAVDADHFGLRLVTLVVLAVVAGDTFAYFAGRALGRHPFFASISPKKTAEGAVAGAAAAILVGAFAGPALVSISIPAGAGLGALVAVAASAGDLAESALKRAAGVKDSGRLIPGHGGLLDRIDSLVLVGPVVYCYLRLVALA
jgi:phosphatidate cytidylyltransferase